jgi:hypothetical protein
MKVIAIVPDNASNNDKMMEHLVPLFVDAGVPFLKRMGAHPLHHTRLAPRGNQGLSL